MQVSERGYGRWEVGSKPVLPHRAAVAGDGRHLGKLHVDHRCRNPLCCNPDHLEMVTNAENRRRARPTHCKRGHELTPENSYIRSNGSGKQCRQCSLDRSRQWWRTNGS